MHKIKVAHATLKLALVYPNSHTLAEQDAPLYEKLDEIVLNNHENIIFVDFNLPYIDWVSQTSPAPGNNLTEFIVDNGIARHMN